MTVESGRTPLPLRIESVGERDLLRWASLKSDQFREQLTLHGAILLSGFDVPDAEVFRQAFCALVGNPISYIEQSSARTGVGEGVYTSTEYPAEREILLHNEQSYNINFPRFISFYCETPALRGGHTPLADTRRILKRIQPTISARLKEHGYTYTRHFGGRMQMSWSKAFQVRDGEALERYCQEHDIACEWLDERGGKRLRTRQRRPVIARHPLSNELVWFNHAAFFHESSLDADLRGMLLEMCGPDNLPHATSYGDGAPFEPELISHLRDAYLQERVTFEWRAGDVLVVDNMLVAHARSAFIGPRRVLVAMSEPCNWSVVIA